jgi:hypothetical protein
VIGQLGLLVLMLSGIEYNCLSEPTVAEKGSHQRLSFARYLGVVKFRVLNELRLDNSFEKYIPVCKVVDKILKVGWLRTIRDVENYLIIVSKVRFLRMIIFNAANDVPQIVYLSFSNRISCIRIQGFRFMFQSILTHT